MSEYDEIENQDTTPDNGTEDIPSVSKSGGSKAGQTIGIVALVVLGLGLVLWQLFSSLNNEDKNPEKAVVEEEYKAASGTSINIPKDTPKEVVLPVINQPPLPVETVKSEPTTKKELTPEERQAIAKAKKLAEARKQSRIVVFDKTQAKQSTGESPDDKLVFDRQDQLFSQLEKTIANGGTSPGASFGGSGGTNSSSIGNNLTGAKTKKVSASYLTNQPYTIAQGKTIGAVLETALSSDLPGMVRAVVSEDVYSFDGATLLIPKQSRLVGEYRSGLKQGISRVFILWTRVITPKGIDVTIDSPSTDPIGRSGQDGEIDTHFFERFGASMLLSVVGAAVANENEDARNVELGKNFNKSAEIALENSININPTIYVNQGVPIKVFVARDLDLEQAFILSR